MIIRNAAKCGECGDVIQSTHRHDYVTCLCGAIAVDGGNEYFRAAGEKENFIPLYVVTDKEFVPESVQLENSISIIMAHHSETCVGKQCPLHNRTDHDMREWEQSIEMVGRTFVVTRICPHDIAHTDPDDFMIYEINYCKKCKPQRKKVVF